MFAKLLLKEKSELMESPEMIENSIIHRVSIELKDNIAKKEVATTWSKLTYPNYTIRSLLDQRECQNKDSDMWTCKTFC